jgi:RNA polymerase sigma-70 factor (ECF subfamily)
MDQKTDKELMRLICNKNSEALKMLYRRYEIKIFNFILRYTGSRETAQELIQETFTRIWFAAHTFDQQKRNFKGWLYAIALNLTRNEMSKKEYTYHFLDADEIRDIHHHSELIESRGPNSIMEQKELKHSIINALGKLEPHLREVIIMKNFQQLKFREIAEATSLPESTLKARYHRAIARLKNYLNTNIPEVKTHV